MWPRHNADFSIFRIYAGADNKPADPERCECAPSPRATCCPISMDGVQEGDFAMIFGFPGNTQRYLSSYAVDYVMNTADPVRIAMRTASLGVIDAAMRSSDRTRLQYADKQSGISNSWKKWIGEVRGLKELRTLQRKREYEAGLSGAGQGEGEADTYATALTTLGSIYSEYVPYATARDLFVEMVYNGPEVLDFANGFTELVEQHAALSKDGKFNEAMAKALAGVDGYFDSYDVEVDKRVFKALLPIYRKHIPERLSPSILQEIDAKYKGDGNAWIDAMYARSVFVDAAKLKAAFRKPGAKAMKKLAADPAYRASKSFFTSFLEQVRPTHAKLSEGIETNMRTYVKGMMVLCSREDLLARCEQHTCGCELWQGGRQRTARCGGDLPRTTPPWPA
jgi:hypothetical protein